MMLKYFKFFDIVSYRQNIKKKGELFIMRTNYAYPLLALTFSFILGACSDQAKETQTEDDRLIKLKKIKQQNHLTLIGPTKRGKQVLNNGEKWILLTLLV